MNKQDSNSTAARLIRIESRVTQLGRWLGADLRLRPPANQPDAPVFINEGKIYASSLCTLGMLSIAVRRHQWPDDEYEAPLILNGIEVGVVNPNIGVDRDEYADA